MLIIKERQIVEEVRFSHDFHWIDDPESGFSFDCDEKGNLLNSNGLVNYQKCTMGEFRDRVVDDGIKKWVRNIKNPAVGLCSCGCEVPLGNFTNTCDNCGADYNFNGDRLAPREQWGEETGETWMECY